MRVLLVNIAGYRVSTPRVGPPASLALLSLKLAAAKRGFQEVELEEFLLRDCDCNILATLLTHEFDLIGFSCYVWNVSRTLTLARTISLQRPQATVVLGGPEAGPVAEEILSQNPFVDVIVHDEGEVVFCDLLEALEGGGRLSTVPGITYRDARGSVVRNPDGPTLEDLSSVPSAYLGTGLDFTRAGYLNLETSRGCPRRCRFCQWGGRKMRFQPLDRVLAEIDVLAGLPALRMLYVVDSCLLYDKRRALTILRALGCMGPSTEIYLEIDMELVDDEVVDALAGLQTVALAFGLQTANPEALRASRRHLDRERLTRNLRLLRRRAPDKGIFFDMIYGLPGDTLKGYRESLDFAMSLMPNGLTLQPFLLLVGSEFYRLRQEFSLEFDTVPPRSVYSSVGFSRADRELARELSYYLQLLYHFPRVRETMNMLWATVNRRRPSGHLEHYEALIRYLRNRVDLSGAWGCIDQAGHQDFGPALTSAGLTQADLEQLVLDFVRTTARHPGEEAGAQRYFADKISEAEISSICRMCALCCNGVLFPRTRITDDEEALLRSRGLSLIRRDPEGLVFLQPCQLLDGKDCRVYLDRPRACATFSCLLLDRLRAGAVSMDEAAEAVRATRVVLEEAATSLGTAPTSDVFHAAQCLVGPWHRQQVRAQLVVAELLLRRKRVFLPTEPS